MAEMLEHYSVLAEEIASFLDFGTADAKVFTDYKELC